MAALAYFGAAVGLQVLFAVIIPIVTSTQLEQNDACYLNETGSVCTFVNVTSGFSLFFSLLLTLAAASTLRQRRAARGPAFLPGVAGSVAAFGMLWWLVTAITVTTRSSQAGDAGLPESSARSGVTALAWLEFVAFLAAVAAVAYDRLAHSRQQVQMARAGGSLTPIAESASSHSQFKQQTFESQQTYEPPQVPAPSAIVTAV